MIFGPMDAFSKGNNRGRAKVPLRSETLARAGAEILLRSLETLAETVGTLNWELPLVTSLRVRVSLALEQRAEALGTEVTPDVVENITYRMYENGKNFSADQYAKATLINHQAGRVLGNFMENYDLILNIFTFK